VSRFPAIPDFSGDIESLGPVLRAMKDSLEELTAQRQGTSLGAPMMFVQEPMPRQDATTRLRYGDLWINSHTQATHYWNDVEWVLTTPEATPFPDTVTNALNLLRSVIAGDGLSGGGELTADRTLNVDATVVRTTRTLTAGTGLTGGGDLSSNRTLGIANGGVDTTQLADTAVTSAKIAANAVRRSENNGLTSSATWSHGSGGGSTNINLLGWAFWPCVDGAPAEERVRASGTGSDSQRITIVNTGTNSGTVRWRYIGA
jgi:hypothetical protein